MNAYVRYSDDFDVELVSGFDDVLAHVPVNLLLRNGFLEDDTAESTRRGVRFTASVIDGILESKGLMVGPNRMERVLTRIWEADPPIKPEEVAVEVHERWP